jgi:hypothetical protein
MLTADRDGDLRQHLLDAGVGVLYKPLKPLALRQTLLRLDPPGVRAAPPAAASPGVVADAASSPAVP